MWFYISDLLFFSRLLFKKLKREGMKGVIINFFFKMRLLKLSILEDPKKKKISLY